MSLWRTFINGITGMPNEAGLDSGPRSVVKPDDHKQDTGSNVNRQDRKRVAKILEATAKHLDSARHGKFGISSKRREEREFAEIPREEPHYSKLDLVRKLDEPSRGADESLVNELQRSPTLRFELSAEPSTPVAERTSAESDELPPSYQARSGDSMDAIASTENNHYSQAVGDFSAAIGARDSLSATMIFEQNKTAIISRHQYEWIEELLDAGYSTTEFIDLIIEEETQSPWIYYDPPSLETADIDTGLHQSGCVHITTSEKADGTLQNNAIETLGCRQAISRLVAEMCGLAGLIPSTGGPSTWNGKSTFEPERWRDSTLAAAVSYGSHGSTWLMAKPELRNLVQISLDALNRALSIAVWLQKSGEICSDHL